MRWAPILMFHPKTHPHCLFWRLLHMPQWAYPLHTPLLGSSAHLHLDGLILLALPLHVQTELLPYHRRGCCSCCYCHQHLSWKLLWTRVDEDRTVAGALAAGDIVAAGWEATVKLCFVVPFAAARWLGAPMVQTWPMAGPHASALDRGRCQGAGEGCCLPAAAAVAAEPGVQCARPCRAALRMPGLTPAVPSREPLNLENLHAILSSKVNRPQIQHYRYPEMDEPLMPCCLSKPGPHACHCY